MTPMEMTSKDFEKFKQHYEWWGLTMNAMRPLLTLEEWAEACQWSIKVFSRIYPNGAEKVNETWPEDWEENWEALK